MSLAALTSRDTVTITRLSSGQGAAGGRVDTYSTGNRGSLPTEAIGRMQPMDADERLEFGVRAERLAWKFLTTTNPSVTTKDRIEFTDNDRDSHVGRVVSPSINLDGQGRLYMVMLEEVTNES